MNRKAVRSLKPTFLSFDFFIDILFPNRCPGCGRVVAWNELFCNECERKIEYLDDLPWYELFPDKVNEKMRSYDYANAVFKYEGTAKNAVLSLKNHGAVHFADFAAERLVLKLESDEIFDIDIITAVPIHKSKRLSRGYNQAEIFADAMGKRLEADCDFSILGHDKSKKAQHELSGGERYKAAENTYFIKDKSRSLKGKNVLLCDDIVTTGSTVDICSQLIKEMGAEKVYVASICRTQSLK